ncbi:MAG TPA: CRISPR-associated endonuclease Cas2 [Candidatus Paceibacterota bacterium]|nr:CRISPR-associated endonuclease Cas2 [Candidatus Paceibacterota bacterium]
MGAQEDQARAARRRGDVQRALLAAVAVPGLVVLAAAAPNVIQLLGGITGSKSKFSYRLKSVASRLAEKGMVRFVTIAGRTHIEITEAGRRELQRHEAGTKKPRRWDRRWRMVMFDIPENRHRLRDAFRRRLAAFGFYRLQDSAWVYPYDCEEFVSLLKTDIGTSGSILYLIVESIERDKPLREHFGI